MKSFYNAIIAMGIVLAIVIPSSIYILYTLDFMEVEIDRLPNSIQDLEDDKIYDAIDDAENLLNKWSKTKKIFGVFIPYYEINRASNELINVYAYLKCHGDQAYRAARMRLKASIKALANSASVSWDNIL